MRTYKTVHHSILMHKNCVYQSVVIAQLLNVIKYRHLYNVHIYKYFLGDMHPFCAWGDSINQCFQVSCS